MLSKMRRALQNSLRSILFGTGVIGLGIGGWSEDLVTQISASLFAFGSLAAAWASPIPQRKLLTYFLALVSMAILEGLSAMPSATTALRLGGGGIIFAIWCRFGVRRTHRLWDELYLDTQPSSFIRAIWSLSLVVLWSTLGMMGAFVSASWTLSHPPSTTAAALCGAGVAIFAHAHELFAVDKNDQHPWENDSQRSGA